MSCMSMGLTLTGAIFGSWPSNRKKINVNLSVVQFTQQVFIG